MTDTESRKSTREHAESWTAVVAFVLNATSVGWVGYAALKPLSIFTFSDDYHEKVQSFLDVMSRGVPVAIGALWASLTLLVLQGGRNRGISLVRVGMAATSLLLIWLVSSGAVDLIDTLSGMGYFLAMVFLLAVAGLTASRAGLFSDESFLSTNTGDAALTAAVISSAAVVAANNAVTCANISAMNVMPPPIPPSI